MKKLALFLFAVICGTGAYATSIGANDTTASCDNNTLGQTSGTANIEVDWQPNTINIRWYDGETQLNVQSSAQSCVYSDDLYLPTAPTKTGYTFKGWTVIDVPAGYTKLEYIEGTGTQWIDTGILSNINIMAEFDFQPTTGSFSKYGVIVGSNVGYQMLITRTTVNSYYASLYNSNSNYVVVYDMIGRVKCKANDKNHNVWLNDVNIGTLVILNPRTENNIGFFDFPSYPGGNTCIGRLFTVKLTNTDTNIIVGNFIPARRNSDNVVGMWDTISGTFFTNSGSGNFIAGPVAE